MKHAMVAIRMILFMTILTGIVYPLVVTGVAKVFFSHQAEGSLIKSGGQIVGSELIAQKFESSKYFWPRPSVGDYNPLPSGGSNLGWISADLKKTVDERKAKLMNAHQNVAPPQDLIFASGSGLDPHMSPEAAMYQLARVAHARNLSEDQISRLQQLIASKTEKRTLGVLGEPRVNVLELNLALDHM